ncbi:MAG TPA: CYTH and CHAD domain-containing protein [Nitrospira sp.]|nr:CYTH and CHAD domain-containing protein [Nitrospira sp.]
MASVKSAIERELKLTVAAGFRLPPLKGARLPLKLLTSVYFDTPDLRLAHARITLRHRTQGRKSAWQLKLPLDCGRREVEIPGKSSTPPPQILDLLFIHLQGGTVQPVATLRTRRTGIRVGGSKGADVVFDEVAFLKGSLEVLVFREVEIEQLDGDASLVNRLENTLRKAGATDHDGRPKIFRALDLPAPQRLTPPESSAHAGAHLRYILGRQLNTMLSRDPGVRLGGDSEDVHQMRVATRRMRSVLRVARPLLKPGWEEPLRDKLRWLGRQLGKARDLDVQIAYFKGQSDSVKPQDRAALELFLEYLQKKRNKVQQQLVNHLRRRRYVTLINRLDPAVREPAMAPDIDVTLPDLARKAFRNVRKAVKKLDDSASNAKWHCVRIQTKRARYAAELSELYSGRVATRFIATIKLIQDQLGDIQDAVIAEDHLRRFTSKTGRPSAFLAGQMIERQRQRQRQAKQAFHSTWKQVTKRGKEAWC